MGQDMTISPATATETAQVPADGNVLHSRPIRPGAAATSVFADDRWDLTPAMFEAHTTSISINWTRTLATFRTPLKKYVWHLLTHVPDTDQVLRHGARPSVQTVVHTQKFLNLFTRMLARRGHRDLSTVTRADIDAWLEEIRARVATQSDNRHALTAVRAWWSRSEILPEDIRLPADVPWGGRVPSELLGFESTQLANRTPRINDVTINALVAWSLRIVEDWGPDVVRLLAERERLRNELSPTTAARIRRGDPATRVAPANRVATARTHADTAATADRIIAFLTEHRLRLPGIRVGDDVRIDGMHLSRLLGWRARVTPTILTRLAASGHPIAEFDETLPYDSLVCDDDGLPWVLVGYRGARKLRRVVRVACLILITYLTGMRTGEVLNLRRGCVSMQGELTVVWGRTFKAVRDENGEKVAQGTRRTAPWVSVPPVAEAVRLLEQIGDSDLLFPRDESPTGQERSVTGYTAAVDIALFVDWINDYCQRRGRPDIIPPDSHRLNLSRFRRTLAWHIVREPRGLVAGALQYGHVHVQMMQGYAGTLDAGFVDDYAFERYLSRLEGLSAESELLAEGAHVSGPAAGEFVARVTSARAHYEGKLARNGREAAVILGNRFLQVHQGDGIHCVFNVEKALCLKTAPTTQEDAPDLPHCRSGCACIAHTDKDVVHLGATIQRYRSIVQDPLAPPIRHQRDKDTLDRLTRIVDNHTRTADSSTRTDYSETVTSHEESSH